MSERESLARLLHDAAMEPARDRSVHVVGWDGLAGYMQGQFLRMADATIAAGWTRGGALFDVEKSGEGP